jgi:hypothetical protein
MSLQFDQERITKRIKESLGKIYTEANPAVLDQYRKLIKKEVSFFKRSYLAAYLLMESDQRSGGRYYGGAGRDERPYRGNPVYGSRKYGNGSDAAGEKQKGERVDYPLAEEESVKLFFSVGRSRKVFPREILGLVISRTSIAKEDIGAIRILDNYSFVQVRNTVADDIINNLNGSMFRGRPLTVNFARIKKDTEAALAGEDRQGDGSGIGDREKPDYESGRDSAGDAFREYDSDDPGANTGDPSTGNSLTEDSAIGDSVTEDPIIRDPVIGDSVIGDASTGDYSGGDTSDKDENDDTKDV